MAKTIWEHELSDPAPPPPPHRAMAPSATRQYLAARANTRSAAWQTGDGSADSELVSSLTKLRGRSRGLVRDASYAKSARRIVVNNVIGAGIGMQAKVTQSRGGKLAKTVNDTIEQAWSSWMDPTRCTMGGEVHFADVERMLMGEVFEAGEVLIRERYAPVGDSDVPYALEIVEAERIAGEYQSPGPQRGGVIRMGVEQDEFYRPLGYVIRQRHPGELRSNMERSDRIEWVPAEQIMHLKVVTRWPQTRGEPWMHAAVSRLNDMDGYSEAEIVAARAAAQYAGAIETPDTGAFGEVDPETGDDVIEVEPGIWMKLRPGEKLTGYAPNRPNTALDPFLRYMIRECAAGIGVSYEGLSKDYSQSNYSSSRLSLLDDRDAWRQIQLWFIRHFRQRVHRHWLQQAVLAGVLPGLAVPAYVADRARFERVMFRPRGWGWIDPEKEVAAYKEAIRGGLTTLTDVIAANGDGKDIEQMIEARRAELDALAEAGIDVDTTFVTPQPVKPSAPPTEAGKPPSGRAGDVVNLR